MKKKERLSLQTKSVGELGKLIEKNREELTKVQLKFGEEKDKTKPRKLRHDIARLLTLQAMKKENKG